MRSNEEILRTFDGGFTAQTAEFSTEWVVEQQNALEAMREAQIEALDEFFSRISPYGQFYAEDALNALKSELTK